MVKHELITEKVFALVPANPEKFLRNYYDHLREQAVIKGGTTYSNTWANSPTALAVVQVDPLPNLKAAENYALTNCSKVYYALAIPYLGTTLQHDADSKKIFEEVKVASQEVEKRCDKIHAEVQGTKSITKGCTKCGSSINRKYINKYCDCPVCGDKSNLMSDSQRKYLKAALDKLDKLKSSNLKTISAQGICYLLAAAIIR